MRQFAAGTFPWYFTTILWAFPKNKACCCHSCTFVQSDIHSRESNVSQPLVNKGIVKGPEQIRTNKTFLLANILMTNQIILVLRYSYRMFILCSTWKKMMLSLDFLQGLAEACLFYTDCILYKWVGQVGAWDSLGKQGWAWVALRNSLLLPKCKQMMRFFHRNKEGRSQETHKDKA